MAKTIKTLDEMDREVMRGGPNEDTPPNDPPENDDDGGEDDDKQQTPPQKTVEERLADMERENAELRGQIKGLSSRPQNPAPQPKKKEAPKREWEKMIFEDTENAIQTLREDIKTEMREELGAAYQQNEGEKEFWRDFWEANTDLKKADDADIAQITLQKNYRELGDLPVSEAIKKLGDLTRERIMKYTGAKKKEPNPKEKVRTEAGGERAPKPPKQEENKIVSLSDLIRARKANRVKAQTKAQTA